jgi:streptomycin 6-kinase
MTGGAPQFRYSSWARHRRPSRGTIVRCNPDSGDDLRVRARRLAARTGVDATAIWEWGTIHRVVAGLYCRKIGFQPFGDLLLSEADRLTG